MMDLVPVTAPDIEELTAFLNAADLTLSGLGSPAVQLWMARDASGNVLASTGYESSADGRNVLIRSVAVDAAHKGEGLGLEAARFALGRAREANAQRAWLFSRRSGAFWQKLGFVAADRDALAAALPSTHQVRLFIETGQLGQESAWSRSL
ncbi:MAG: GNAT family N-acetyltransferase [Rhodoglobus sp.]